MKRILSIALLGFILLIWSESNSTAYAQKQGQALIDSLHSELPKQKEDTNKVNILNELAWHNIQIANYNTSLMYAKAAKSLAKKLDFKKGIVSAYNNIGIVCSLQGNYPEALKNNLASLKIVEETSTGSVKDLQGLAASYINTGVIYSNQRNYSEALKYYFDALKLFKSTSKGVTGGIFRSYNNIGAVYGNQGNQHEALKYYFSALKVAKELDFKRGIAGVYNNIGEVYSNQGDYSEALKNFFDALKIFEKIQAKMGLAFSYSNIGNAYIKLNQVADGKVWLQKGLALSRKIGAKDRIKVSYEGLALADSALGNYKGAYENYKMFVLYQDSIHNEENTKKLTQTKMQYEFDKKEATTKAKQEKKDIRQRNIRNFSFAGIGGLLIFLLVVMRQRNKVKREKARSEELLHNILPVEVADELKEKGQAEAHRFDNVTVLFTDFVNFTQTAEQLTPEQLVQELHECFTAFDNIIERKGLEKIKTIGDAYLAVCGLPTANPQHAQKTVHAALEIRDFMAQRMKKEKTFEIRIGIHSGSLVAGIVGVKKFAYDIWGDTVNTAARMEQTGEAGKVNISETTYEIVKEEFPCEYRGEVEAKHKGKLKMYFVGSPVIEGQAQ